MKEVFAEIDSSNIPFRVVGQLHEVLWDIFMIFVYPICTGYVIVPNSFLQIITEQVSLLGLENNFR